MSKLRLVLGFSFFAVLMCAPMAHATLSGTVSASVGTIVVNIPNNTQYARPTSCSGIGTGTLSWVVKNASSSCYVDYQSVRAVMPDGTWPNLYLTQTRAGCSPSGTISFQISCPTTTLQTNFCYGKVGQYPGTLNAVMEWQDPVNGSFCAGCTIGYNSSVSGSFAYNCYKPAVPTTTTFSTTTNLSK